MKKSNRIRILLIEILIATLVFALAATVSLRVFAAARMQSSSAEIGNTIQTEVQNLSEECYVREDAEGFLTEKGFSPDGDSYVYTCEDYVISCVIENEKTDAGTLRSVVFTASIDEEPVLTVPCVRYFPEVVTQ